ncbi:MAG: hypothetical protein WBH98_03285 [Bacteroidales bacterium]
MKNIRFLFLSVLLLVGFTLSSQKYFWEAYYFNEDENLEIEYILEFNEYGEPTIFIVNDEDIICELVGYYDEEYEVTELYFYDEELGREGMYLQHFYYVRGDELYLQSYSPKLKDFYLSIKIVGFYNLGYYKDDFKLIRYDENKDIVHEFELKIAHKNIITIRNEDGRYVGFVLRKQFCE